MMHSGQQSPDAVAVWVNGVREESRGGGVSPLDRGLTLGDGVFETMRLEAGTIFRLDRHLQRLAQGLQALEIRAPSTIRRQVERAVEQAGIRDGGVRLTVTRGAGAGGLRPPDDAVSTVVVAVSLPWSSSPHLLTTGIAVHVASGRCNELAMTVGLKTVAYADAVAAWLEARRAGADDALFLDTAGHCSEATTSNLFACCGGILVTPPPSCGALPGITRDAILAVAGELGVPTAERILELEELHRAEEAFLTSSLRGLAPVVRVDARTIADGVPGALTGRLAAAYTALVRRECGG